MARSNAPSPQQLLTRIKVRQDRLQKGARMCDQTTDLQERRKLEDYWIRLLGELEFLCDQWMEATGEDALALQRALGM